MSQANTNQDYQLMVQAIAKLSGTATIDPATGDKRDPSHDGRDHGVVMKSALKAAFDNERYTDVLWRTRFKSERP
jgi:hypothetical protein